MEHEFDVDAVFVIGNGSKHGNEELRYALRNLEAHCKFIRNVYICGECPEWVDTSKVIYLPWPDRFRHAKDANMIDKIRHACETDGIAKHFLKCSDDQFQTRECCWDDFRPMYCRKYSSTDDFYEKNKGKTRWYLSVRDTMEREKLRREELGLEKNDIYYYEPHIWMPMDRDKFIEYAKWCDYEHRKDVIIGSGYYNFVGESPRRREDHTYISSSSERPPTTLHAAYNDSSYDRAMSFLVNMFPRPCIFEKHCRESVFQDIFNSRIR